MAATDILVIKLGALGDFVQAMGPFAAIRAHHPGARITLLTTRPFAELARACPWFDAVWLDDKPPLWRLDKVLALAARLRGGRFRRVYDLQTSDRSSWYFRLMGGPGRVGGQSNIPEWSGIARGCSHPHANPQRDSMHTIERQREQLAMAGIAKVPPPDLAWAEAAPGRFDIAGRFVLLVPGGAPHRPAKRWPAERFGRVALWLAERGVTPVLLGTDKERAEIDAIRAVCPQAVDLAEKTGLPDIIALARRAEAALGNDTGPMHLIAAGGCPSVVLFSHGSDPALCAPRGNVTVLRRSSLADLGEAEVEAALGGMLPAP
ncbi:ADP-heptose of LPS heptosyltransferase [Paramagnetospirillum caucaseum]|uniref:ADP-heptose of LPS heptosyltransferase n=1 Tax=Paramagnetospirillum caucaseum TaxID=1244869 RepID=M2Z314_9PROT|nr:glycosyltransferase family 9 protein [Paramagnetospirillum caucaseum]EME68730.1 ADP-heptose of LPS heptosyltransferase [Paramagnetospirillum caucaseum]